MASLSNQVNALLRKSLAYHKHHVASNVRIVLFPVVFFVLIAIIQNLTSKATKSELQSKSFNATGEINPPLLQVPSPTKRAVKSQSFIPYADLPDESCRKNGSCPVTILLTGKNKTLAQDVTNSMLSSSLTSTMVSKDVLNSMAIQDLGTYESTMPYFTRKKTALKDYFVEIIESDEPKLYQIQLHCLNSSTYKEFIGAECVEALPLWRNNYSEINDELFKGYHNGNSEGKTNQILGAYDFQTTSEKNLYVIIGYNSTYENPDSISETEIPNVVRVQKAENMIANGFLQYLHGPSTRIILESVAEMPGVIPIIKKSGGDPLDMFLLHVYVWIIVQLLPIMLQTLVYERQQKLRMMMRMHGLGHTTYWLINYMYFLIMSTIYICFFIVAGTLTGLKLFTKNSISVQFTFYFIYINLQISLGFLLSLAFKSVKSASVVGFLMVFTGGMFGIEVMQWVMEKSVNRIVAIALEIYPVFALTRGLFEFHNYATGAYTLDTFGFQWHNMKDGNNGIMETVLVMTATWFVFLVIGYLIDKYSMSSSFFSLFRKSGKKAISSYEKHNDTSQESHTIQMEKDDIAQEIERVLKLRSEPDSSYPTICYNLKKIYPGKDGEPDKFAVKGVNLALPRGECFGILGPNGAGKTTFISMMTGLLEPSFGTASIEGFDIGSQMNMIHTIMGVCPQFDVLWDILTPREHLNFYGRLKNLTGPSLRAAVDDCLAGVELLDVADKKAGQFSGGMKRRLSVAISLIGNPKIVYLDEPSTGLDPGSRKKLWEVLRRQKKDKTLVLTTHSMEEAERLCDRIGIFADGRFLCLGSPDELKNRYGGHYMLTIATHPQNVEDVRNMLKHLTARARRTYLLGGTQKFEIPKVEVRKAEIFQLIRSCRNKYPVDTWGISGTTLEEVFIKVVTEEEDSSHA